MKHLKLLALIALMSLEATSHAIAFFVTNNTDDEIEVMVAEAQDDKGNYITAASIASGEIGEIQIGEIEIPIHVYVKTKNSSRPLKAYMEDIENKFLAVQSVGKINVLTHIIDAEKYTP